MKLGSNEDEELFTLFRQGQEKLGFKTPVQIFSSFTNIVLFGS